MDYSKLDVWVEARKLVNFLYDSTKLFPKDEIFGLTNQMRRAAISIPSNIAEGHAGGSGSRYRYYVRLSLGSLAELDTQLEVALRLKYIDRKKFEELAPQLVRTRQLLHGLHRSLLSNLALRTLVFAALLCGSSTLLFS